MVGVTPFVMHASGAVTVFPPVQGRTSGSTSVLTANPVLDLSALPRDEGNVLVLVFRSQSATHSGPSGWTHRGTHAVTTSLDDDKVSVYTKVASSSESASQAFTQSGSDRCGWTCIEVSGVATSEGAWFAIEMGDGLDPPSVTIPWGALANRLITSASVGASSNTLTAPSGYVNQIDGASETSTAATRVRVATADRADEVATENPAAWNESGTTFHPASVTIALRPA